MRGPSNQSLQPTIAGAGAPSIAAEFNPLYFRAVKSKIIFIVIFLCLQFLPINRSTASEKMGSTSPFKEFIGNTLMNASRPVLKRFVINTSINASNPRDFFGTLGVIVIDPRIVGDGFGIDGKLVEMTIGRHDYGFSFGGAAKGPFGNLIDIKGTFLQGSDSNYKNKLDAGENAVGGEFDVSLFMLKLNLGAFRNLSQKNNFFSVGIGMNL